MVLTIIGPSLQTPPMSPPTSPTTKDNVTHENQFKDGQPTDTDTDDNNHTNDKYHRLEIDVPNENHNKV